MAAATVPKAITSWILTQRVVLSTRDLIAATITNEVIANPQDIKKVTSLDIVIAKSIAYGIINNPPRMQKAEKVTAAIQRGRRLRAARADR